jgi:HlyD family secretion protein
MRRSSLLRWLFGLIVIAALVAVAFRYVSHRRGTTDQAQFRTVAVDRGDVTMTVTATGSLSAVTTVQVGSQVSGIIKALYADFNTRVKAGQLLAELDPTPFEAQVEQRRADLMQGQVQLRNAEIALHRQERLLASGLTSEAEYDSAKAAADGAKALVEQGTAALSQAQTNLQYTKIRSPIDGVVVSRQYDVGQTVAASFQAPTLFTIAQDLTQMQVQADVDQADIGQIRTGQVARFTVDAYPEHEFRGTITQVRLNATVNQNVITYPVIIEVPNPDGRLRPQMTADVTIEVATVHDVLRVPNAALRFRPTEESDVEAAAPAGAAAASRPPGAVGGAAGARRAQGGAGPDGGQRPEGGRRAQGAVAEAGPTGPARVVYRLAPDGKLQPVPIRTGLTDGRVTEVVSGGLEEGDRVVVGLATARVSVSGRGPRMRGF